MNIGTVLLFFFILFFQLKNNIIKSVERENTLGAMFSGIKKCVSTKVLSMLFAGFHFLEFYSSDFFFFAFVHIHIQILIKLLIILN